MNSDKLCIFSHFKGIKIISHNVTKKANIEYDVSGTVYGSHHLVNQNLYFNI